MRTKRVYAVELHLTLEAANEKDALEAIAKLHNTLNQQDGVEVEQEPRHFELTGYE